MRSTSKATGAKLAALVVLGIMALAGCSAGAGSSSADGGGDPAVEAPGAAGDEDIADDDRAVVIEGSMQIVVADAQKAANVAASAAAAAGGRVDGREEQNEDGSGGRSATLVLRIPAAALDDALDRLRELGEVESILTSTTDVTTASRDLDARISGLTTTLTRLTSFQGAAKTVDDLLEIEKEISSRQTQLEELRTQKAAMDEQIAFSTITLTLQEKQAPALVAPDSFWSGLGVGWAGMVAFIGGFIVVLGVALPWLALVGIIVAVVLVLVRLTRRRKAARVVGVPQGAVMTQGAVVSQGETPPPSAPPGSHQSPS